MRAFSFGGGIQSTAALVLAAQGRIDYRVFLFASVGDDSENPETLEYVRRVSLPFAQAHGLELHELQRDTNGGETLYQRTLREMRSIGIPVRMGNGAPGSRNCTQDYKRAVVRKWLGAGDHVVGLGMSWDELHRLRPDSGYKNIVNEYPLIDLRLRRSDCLTVIREAGLPEPPKSACWFCPFHSLPAWGAMRRRRPDLFRKAVELEELLNKKRAALGRDRVWLTAKAQPLDQAIGDQPELFSSDEPCDTGYCFT